MEAVETKGKFRLVLKKHPELLDRDSEFFSFIKDIIFSDECLKRLNFSHHGDYSVFEHGIDVAWMAYRIAIRLKLPKEKRRTVAVAGLLHDFYENDFHKKVIWSSNKSGIFKKIDEITQMHFFTHASTAAENAKVHYPKEVSYPVWRAIKSHHDPIRRGIFKKDLEKNEWLNKREYTKWYLENVVIEESPEGELKAFVIETYEEYKQDKREASTKLTSFIVCIADKLASKGISKEVSGVLKKDIYEDPIILGETLDGESRKLKQ